MELFPNVLCGWSWEENKQFELALAVVDEQDPDRWEVVASMVGGKKSAEDVQKHYVILLEDLQCIESGQFDHQIGEPQSCTFHVDCVQSVCWTDEDHNALHILNGIDSMMNKTMSSLLGKKFAEKPALLFAGRVEHELIAKQLAIHQGRKGPIWKLVPFKSMGKIENQIVKVIGAISFSLYRIGSLFCKAEVVNGLATSSSYSYLRMCPKTFWSAVSMDKNHTLCTSSATSSILLQHNVVPGELSCVQFDSYRSISRRK